MSNNEICVLWLVIINHKVLLFLLQEDFEHVTQLYENEIFSLERKSLSFSFERNISREISLESNANSLKYNKVL